MYRSDEESLPLNPNTPSISSSSSISKLFSNRLMLFSILVADSTWFTRRLFLDGSLLTTGLFGVMSSLCISEVGLSLSICLLPFFECLELFVRTATGWSLSQGSDVVRDTGVGWGELVVVMAIEGGGEGEGGWVMRNSRSVGEGVILVVIPVETVVEGKLMATEFLEVSEGTGDEG